MLDASPLVLLSASVVGVVIAVVAGRWLTRLARTDEIMRQLDDMQSSVTAWQTAHGARIRGLERQMTDTEISVLRAEDDAHRAFVQIASIRDDLLRRVEQVEQQLEIQLLVDQGRIPREHLPEPGAG